MFVYLERIYERILDYHRQIEKGEVSKYKILSLTSLIYREMKKVKPWHFICAIE